MPFFGCWGQEAEDALGVDEEEDAEDEGCEEDDDGGDALGEGEGGEGFEEVGLEVVGCGEELRFVGLRGGALGVGGRVGASAGAVGVGGGDSARPGGSGGFWGWGGDW